MAIVPKFKVIEGWEKLPKGYVHKDVDGVAVDSKDNVYLMTRQDARVIVYDREGNFVRSWGEGHLHAADPRDRHRGRHGVHGG